MKKMSIDIKTASYDIYIGDVLSKIPHYIKDDQAILVITDDNVKSNHLETLKKYVNTPYYFTLGSEPEKGKSLAFYEACVKYCLKHYLTRNLLVVAFGGGSVTDFAGFFASTYKRGVSLIHLPTTLLSHDSAVGGKTGINIGQVKNVVGTFYQPKVVLYHLAFLKTLPKKEIYSGFGEVIKHDLLSDGYLLNEVLDHDLCALVQDETKMEDILYHAILVKKLYIEMDIYDRLGRRQFLNFGHTLAHGIEILTGYSHGEAVCFGMCFDLFISGNPLYKILYDKLINWGYFKDLPDFDLMNILEAIKNDKKNTENQMKFIGLEEVGAPYEINLTSEEFLQKYKVFKQVLLCD